MFKLYVSSLFFITCVAFGYAHDSDKAYFNITREGSQTIVYAEFPWSIRNALIAFDSSFNNAKTIEEINAIVFNYTKEKIKLFDTKGKQLPLVKVVFEKNNEEHNHATHYKFVFKGSEISKVLNTMMFEYIKSQENCHWYTNGNGIKKETITDNISPYFMVTNKSNYFMYYLIGGLLLVGLIVFSLKKK